MWLARRKAVRLCDCFFLGTAIGRRGYQGGDRIVELGLVSSRLAALG